MYSLSAKVIYYHETKNNWQIIINQFLVLLIGMQNSSQFASALLQALQGRKKLTKLTKRELYGNWLRLSNPSYDSSIQILFDM